MSDLERAIYAAAFVRCFFESNRDKNDEDRVLRAEEEADALVAVRRRARGWGKTESAMSSEKVCGEPFETADPQDPIRCHLPAGHGGPHQGQVSWGAI